MVIFLSMDLFSGKLLVLLLGCYLLGKKTNTHQGKSVDVSDPMVSFIMNRAYVMHYNKIVC